jgi:hypothetical protein
MCFLFADYKINEQLGKGKKEFKGQRGEGIYNNNNNNSILNLMQKTKIEWKL